ncbi:hypothetical protein AncyloWKF20_07420 [Ancylobacter sp. WKF20]|uniref:hypothetical protein n=1 Tax=Ancylobacter sp. WKF20 TaxID=3039801 RepID=UPI0024344CA4|nr:hypothetical protein [Ancylobacter sp. WKF20]WGD31639.1 hypothetical protein AncyloWKF20_07420 [Ancylobacter sp. WKF20]
MSNVFGVLVSVAVTIACALALSYLNTWLALPDSQKGKGRQLLQAKAAILRARCVAWWQKVEEAKAKAGEAQSGVAIARVEQGAAVPSTVKAVPAERPFQSAPSVTTSHLDGTAVGYSEAVALRTYESVKRWEALSSDGAYTAALRHAMNYQNTATYQLMEDARRAAAEHAKYAKQIEFARQLARTHAEAARSSGLLRAQ